MFKPYKLAPVWLRDLTKVNRFLSFRSNILVRGYNAANQKTEADLNCRDTVLSITPYRIRFLQNGQVFTILRYRLYVTDEKYQRRYNSQKLARFTSPYETRFSFVENPEHTIPADLRLTAFLRQRLIRGLWGREGLVPQSVQGTVPQRPIPDATHFQLTRVEKLDQHYKGWLVYVNVTTMDHEVIPASIVIANPQYLIHVADVF